MYNGMGIGELVIVKKPEMLRERICERLKAGMQGYVDYLLN